MVKSAPLRLFWTLVLSAVFIFMAAGNLWALEVPALKQRVNDYAELINPSTQQQLETALAQLEQTDSTQIAVLTITSLEGDSLEDFSIRVVEQWKLGQKDADNGVLLLISKNDRKIRIEVGYGLEGKLTDLTAGRIIRQVISPQFKMGRFDQGIIDGVSALVSVVRGEFKAPPENRRGTRRKGTSPGMIGLFALFFFMNMLSRIHRFLGAGIGAVLAPIAGVLFFKMGLLGALALIPIGFAGGLLLSLFGGPLTFGHTTTHRRGGGGYWGGGGFGSGGGGFGGGGGGFGGGGASGGW